MSIKIENVDVFGWEAAIRGMRNPMNSWDKSDSFGCNSCQICDKTHCVGKKDLALMRDLVRSGSDHAKFMRMLNVTLDVVAPLYWWKELDTYKIGTVANSCSTMHKIHAKEFTLDDFSIDHLNVCEICEGGTFDEILKALNYYREKYLKSNDKIDWWQMIQLLPSSYNQRRTVQLNYQVLRNIYFARRNHKLDEWREFCSWVETLPYAKELICVGGENDDH